MLTEEQIKNWRNALSGRIGPYAFFMPESDVQLFSENMQIYIDKRNFQYWNIKIRLDKNTNWNQIKVEPKHPYCSLFDIRQKCNDLLAKHLEIDAIEIFDPMDSSNTYIFDRDIGEISTE